MRIDEVYVKERSVQGESERELVKGKFPGRVVVVLSLTRKLLRGCNKR
jgi:hypothetical protein